MRKVRDKVSGYENKSKKENVMNRAQKTSWSLVISMSLAMILCIVAFVIHYFRVGSARPFIFSAAGVMGIGVLLVFRLKTDKGAITHDERDKLIEKNAHLAGFGVVYLLVILVSFIPLGIAPEAKIPTKWFPGLLIRSCILSRLCAIISDFDSVRLER